MKTREMAKTKDLDLAVARIEGLPLKHDPMKFGNQSPGGWWVWYEGFPPKLPYMQVGKQYSPSTNWAQGGPIIEREGISIRKELTGWYAVKPFEHTFDPFGTWSAWDGSGDTALEAAMDCYINSKEDINEDL